MGVVSLLPALVVAAPVAGASGNIESVPASLSPRVITFGNPSSGHGQVTYREGTQAPAGDYHIEFFVKKYGDPGYTLNKGGSPQYPGGEPFRIPGGLADRQYAVVVRVTDAAGDVGQTAPLVQAIHTRVDLSSPAPGRTGPTMRVAGAATPAHPGEPVGVGRIVNGRYQYLGQGTADQSGAFDFTITVPRGDYTFVVYTSPRAGNLGGGRSAALQVR